MGIKAFNHGDDFVNKFVRAVVSDSTGLDAASEFVPPEPTGHTATGGVVGDYTEPGPGNVYRAHVFTSSGTFNITSLSNTFPETVEYLVVAGGGGGGKTPNGETGGAGGGGGGYIQLDPFPVSALVLPSNCWWWW